MARDPQERNIPVKRTPTMTLDGHSISIPSHGEITVPYEGGGNHWVEFNGNRFDTTGSERVTLLFHESKLKYIHRFDSVKVAGIRCERCTKEKVD